MCALFNSTAEHHCLIRLTHSSASLNSFHFDFRLVKWLVIWVINPLCLWAGISALVCAIEVLTLIRIILSCQINQGISKCNEAWFHTSASFGRSFKDAEACSLGELHHIFFWDLSLRNALLIRSSLRIILFLSIFYHVIFICDYDNLDVRLGVIVHLLEPVVEVGEAGSIKEVKYKDDAVSSLVVCIGNGPISFLPCSIPYL